MQYSAPEFIRVQGQEMEVIGYTVDAHGVVWVRVVPVEERWVRTRERLRAIAAAQIGGENEAR